MAGVLYLMPHGDEPGDPEGMRVLRAAQAVWLAAVVLLVAGYLSMLVAGLVVASGDVTTDDTRERSRTRVEPALHGTPA